MTCRFATVLEGACAGFSIQTNLAPYRVEASQFPEPCYTCGLQVGSPTRGLMAALCRPFANASVRLQALPAFSVAQRSLGCASPLINMRNWLARGPASTRPAGRGQLLPVPHAPQAPGPGCALPAGGARQPALRAHPGGCAGWAAGCVDAPLRGLAGRKQPCPWRRRRRRQQRQRRQCVSSGARWIAGNLVSVRHCCCFTAAAGGALLVKLYCTSRAASGGGTV